MTSDRAPVMVVSSSGDPRDRKTWSGTPAGILAAFDKIGVPVSTRVLGIERPLKYLYGATNVMQGLGTLQPDRVGLWSADLRRSADAVVQEAGPGTFLHFGTSHLPLQDKPPGQRHFLLTDYSIHLLMTKGVLGEKAPERYRKRVLATEAAVARQMDGIFTVSRYVRDDWVQTYGLAPDRVVAVGTGLGSPLTLEGYRKNYSTGHLLFVAKHGFDIKGGPLLLAGFLEALKTRPDLRLVVIADARDPTLVPHLATMQSHSAIDFRQSGTPDFVDLVRSAALYAGPAEREPWGLIYLESLMCETPVLGLDRNAMRELTDDGRIGFIVGEASGAAVGAAIIEAMSDPTRLAHMGRAGRAFVESTFTWDRVAETMLDRMQR